METITPDLVRRLKRLRLGGLLPTLPDRVAHARQATLSPVEWLELLLQDEIDRPNSQTLAQRLAAAVAPFASARSSALGALSILCREINLLGLIKGLS